MPSLLTSTRLTLRPITLTSRITSAAFAHTRASNSLTKGPSSTWTPALICTPSLYQPRHPCHRQSAVHTTACAFSTKSTLAGPAINSTHSSSTTTTPSSATPPPTNPLTPPLPAPLFVTTRHIITGRVITQDLGLVAASAFRSRNLFIDVLVAITRIFGGETPDYTVLLNDCTEKATQRLEATARAAGATSVVGVRYTTTTTMNRMIVGLHCSVMASGTAVIDVDEKEFRGAPPINSH